jgi:hypothetical protein
VRWRPYHSALSHTAKTCWGFPAGTQQVNKGWCLDSVFIFPSSIWCCMSELMFQCKNSLGRVSSPIIPTPSSIEILSGFMSVRCLTCASVGWGCSPGSPLQCGTEARHRSEYNWLTDWLADQLTIHPAVLLSTYVSVGVGRHVLYIANLICVISTFVFQLCSFYLFFNFNKVIDRQTIIEQM